MAFGNWAVQDGRITVNPLQGLQKQNERADRRRVRRALSQDESARLIHAAARRPLAKNQTNRGSAANLSSDTVDALQWLGATRAMAYRVMLLTGLRFGELRSITIGAACVEHDPPYLDLAAADEKARRGAQIPLQRDLARDLSHFARNAFSGLRGIPRPFRSAV